MSPEDAQRTADVAQFYLLAAGQYAAPYFPQQGQLA